MVTNQDFIYRNKLNFGPLFQRNKQHLVKVLLTSFPLNGHTLGIVIVQSNEQHHRKVHTAG